MACPGSLVHLLRDFTGGDFADHAVVCCCFAEGVAEKGAASDAIGRMIKHPQPGRLGPTCIASEILSIPLRFLRGRNKDAAGCCTAVTVFVSKRLDKASSRT